MLNKREETAWKNSVTQAPYNPSSSSDCALHANDCQARQEASLSSKFILDSMADGNKTKKNELFIHESPCNSFVLFPLAKYKF